jgi:hypothetical protein
MRVGRQAVVWVCLGWFSSCPYFDRGSNARPLEFGMNPEAAAAALNTKLIPLAGRNGSQVYYAEVPSSIPGFTNYQDQIWLEFRRGRLTGWNNDWQRRSLW